MTSTNDIATETKDQARGLADHAQGASQEIATSARSAASDIAGTAKDQASAVASTTRNEVRDLAGQATDQLRTQAEEQTRRLGQAVRQMSEQLQQMAADSGSAGPARDLVHQAARHGLRAADFVESRGPAGLVDELQRFARRRPGLFLLSAAVAGAAVGRATRATKAASRSDDAQAVSYAGQTPHTASSYGEPLDLRAGAGGEW